MKPVRIGIVGFGKMGILHAGILNALPDCTVGAICEKEPLIRRLASKVMPGIRFFESPFDMVSKEELDAVFVTSPIASHAPVVSELACASKRLGLFIEKPLAGKTEEAQSIIEAASEFATTTMIGFQKRFLSQFVRTKELIASGALGDVVSFDGYSYLASVFSRGSGWRFKRGEGGALLDLGSHLVDLVIWYFGTPSSVHATESAPYSDLVEDYAEVEFGFPSGLSGKIEVSWSKEGYRLPEAGMKITGTNGSIRVTDDTLELDILREIPALVKAGKTVFSRPELTEGVRFLLGDPEYCVEDEYFVTSLISGNGATPNLMDGLVVNKLIDQGRSNARRL